MLEFIKSFDLITGNNVIFYKGSSNHSSIIGALLSILVYSILFVAYVYYSLEFIRKKSPTSYYFKQFIPDAGIYYLDNINTKSIFHFFQVNDEKDNVMRDDDMVMVLGAQSYATNYFGLPGVDYNLENEDTWVYDTCDENDFGFYKSVITEPKFFQSLCIKQFWNSKERRLYSQNQNGFKYPTIEHGTSTKVGTNIGYSIQVMKCINVTFRNIVCKPKEEIDEYVEKNLVRVKLGLIDHDFDVQEYKTPVLSYINEIKNDIRGSDFTNNNLNFSPVKVATDKGILFKDVRNSMTYKLDLNEKLTYKKSDAPYLLSGWAFFMGNKQETYTRSYQKLQQYLSAVGGISKTIFFAAEVLNYLNNKFTSLQDKTMLYSEIFVRNDSSKMNLKNSCPEQGIEMTSMKNSLIKLNEQTSYSKIHMEKKTNYSIMEFMAPPKKTIAEELRVLSEIKTFSFFDFLKGKYLCNNEIGNKIQEVNKFWTKVISEENMIKLTLQLSIMIDVFNEKNKLEVKKIGNKNSIRLNNYLNS